MNVAAIFSLLARLMLPLAALALLYAVDHRAEQRGYDKAQLQAKTSELSQLSFAIERSGQLATRLGQITDDNLKDKADAKHSIDALSADLRSGALRLSVRTTGQPPASGGSAAAGPGQARAELDPATAEALVRITADGDNAIRDLNTCIDQYAEVRRAQEAGHAQTD
ncbi:hypothetical protein DZC30_04965 [Comamonas testosteroni]|uniref:Lysozyme n=1 Tax=Comamonas testosteroni TaxID=285 RepID=A0A373FPM9_COMTE|nr:lysis system i-spanin subunit Rz [Comamonas testosteroni]RGE46121.1 hypothetical protein DZC30_04965 [Comamonas testosteroni]